MSGYISVWQTNCNTPLKHHPEQALTSRIGYCPQKKHANDGEDVMSFHVPVPL